ncbi:MAG: SAF domain-containing protein [Bifidobacteriaceae bacterium]|jgi:hypothetical protein|nr:SAF domain-containing protein [Bifidobacteriaceae bacterium]
MLIFKKEIDPSQLIWHGKKFLAAFLISMTVISLIFKIIDSVPKGTSVVVASRNIAAGKIIIHDDLQVLQVSQNVVTSQTIKDPNLIIDNKTSVDVYKGQILADNLLVGNNENLTTPPGKVALALVLNDSSNGKIFKKGDSINILTLASDGKKIIYLAKDALILSPINEQDNDQQFNALIAVNQKEAEQLAVTNGLQPLTALKN